MASQLHPKQAQQTGFNESKLRKQICIKLTFVLFQERSNPLNYVSEFADQSESATASSPLKKFCYQTITSNLFFFASQLVSEKFSQIKSLNLQFTDCIVNKCLQLQFCHKNFKNWQSTTDLQNLSMAPDSIASHTTISRENSHRYCKNCHRNR